MDSTTTFDEPPTTDLTASLATPSTDRCPNCGARMAIDQRYCIVCGERRTGGGLRDALPRTQTAAPAAASAPRGPRLSPSASLIAGVATLLLALGVGVLIGRSGDNGSKAAATPQVVTVQGTSAGTNGTSAAGAATAAGTAAAVKHASKKHKASSSSKSVSGSSSVDATAKKNGVQLPPKVVKVGQKCAKGAKGCQGGKFTGNFFGGG